MKTIAIPSQSTPRFSIVDSETGESVAHIQAMTVENDVLKSSVVVTLRGILLDNGRKAMSEFFLKGQ